MTDACSTDLRRSALNERKESLTQLLTAQVDSNSEVDGDSSRSDIIQGVVRTLDAYGHFLMALESIPSERDVPLECSMKGGSNGGV